FFSLVADRLNPGGVVVINVGHPKDSPDLEKVLAATMREAFGDDSVYRDPSEPVNTVLLGTKSSEPTERLRRHAQQMPNKVADVALEAAARMEPALRGGRVYTDDLAPVEWLVD